MLELSKFRTKKIQKSEGGETWKNPSNLEESTTYLVKIIDLSDPNIYAYSEYFEIKKTKKAIPGYNLPIMLGLISFISAVIASKRKQN